MSELRIDDADYLRYEAIGFVEARPYYPGESMAGISVSDEDKKAGSPKEGDMIARNPVNHSDRWLIAEEYFNANYAVPVDPDQEWESLPGKCKWCGVQALQAGSEGMRDGGAAYCASCDRYQT